MIERLIDLPGRRRRGRKSDDYTDMPAEMLSSREGPTDPPDPTVTSGSPLFFAPTATGRGLLSVQAATGRGLLSVQAATGRGLLASL